MSLDPIQTNKVLNNFGERVTKLARINIGKKKKGRKIDNTGTLRKSIGFDLETFKSGNFSFSFFMEDYGENVDQGRKPGKGIPVKELMSWIKSKPIRLRDLETGKFVKTTKAGLNSLSFLINRKIKKEGIEKTNFFTDPLEREFKKLPEQLVKSFSLDLDTFLEASLK
ncbi:MAG: hypothetical protein JKY54_17725 [Flavobacteriales bacterium]|nr:hypothetical protein [Flavobacteriales bacterium]